jgi:hypothetical protein
VYLAETGQIVSWSSPERNQCWNLAIGVDGSDGGVFVALDNSGITLKDEYD